MVRARPLGHDRRVAHERPYLEVTPEPTLSAHVDRFWSRASTGRSGAHRVLPDGCVDLLLDLRTGEVEIVGTMRRAALVPGGPSDLVAIRFRPGTAARIVRAPLASLADRSVPAAELGIDARALVERLSRTPPGPARVAMLAAFVRARLADAEPPDPIVRRAVRALTQRPRPSIGGLTRELGVTRQHLARLFAREVGVGPKELARIARMQRTVMSLADGRRDFAALAHAHGYADQPHLVNELRELAGATPAVLAAEAGGSISPIASVFAEAENDQALRPETPR